jgi:hypothetical protein
VCGFLQHLPQLPSPSFSSNVPALPPIEDVTQKRANGSTSEAAKCADYQGNDNRLHPRYTV